MAIVVVFNPELSRTSACALVCNPRYLSLNYMTQCATKQYSQTLASDPEFTVYLLCTSCLHRQVYQENSKIAYKLWKIADAIWIPVTQVWILFKNVVAFYFLYSNPIPHHLQATYSLPYIYIYSKLLLLPIQTKWPNKKKYLSAYSPLQKKQPTLKNSHQAKRFIPFLIKKTIKVTRYKCKDKTCSVFML